MSLGRVLTLIFASQLIIYSIILLLSAFNLFEVDQELMLVLMDRVTYPLVTTMSYTLGRAGINSWRESYSYESSAELESEFGSDDSEVE